MDNGYTKGAPRKSTNVRHSKGERVDVTKERKSSTSNNESQRETEKVEVANKDGWPKWLTDNIPREALKDIVPKSADSYIKIDKVIFSIFSNICVLEVLLIS